MLEYLKVKVRICSMNLQGIPSINGPADMQSMTTNKKPNQIYLQSASIIIRHEKEHNEPGQQRLATESEPADLHSTLTEC